MRISLLILLSASLLFAQASNVVEKDTPTVVAFVAPAYPRAAKDQRKMGKTLTRITVNPQGTVTDAKTLSANSVFESYVLEALKKWRFQPSERERTLEVTCSFEFIEDKCEGTNVHPITSETYISADLPTVVHIKTGLQCVETSDSHNRHQ
jgi:TonB family protein